MPWTGSQNFARSGLTMLALSVLAWALVIAIVLAAWFTL